MSSARSAPTPSSRAGRYVRQAAGYAAFVPASLPPDPPVDTSAIVDVLSRADIAIGRLNAVRTSIEMAPALDAALDAVLAETLDIDRG